jgi:hypothetical protein
MGDEFPPAVGEILCFNISPASSQKSEGRSCSGPDLGTGEVAMGPPQNKIYKLH